MTSTPRSDGPDSADADAPAPQGGLEGDFGMPAVEHFQSVLLAAAERAPSGHSRLLILTHRGPDPDAIGACEGVRHLCAKGFGLDSTVATVGRIHRAENLAMVRALELEFSTYKEVDPKDYFGAVLVDTQPGFGHTLLPDDIPVLAIFDHHVPPAMGEGEERPGADHHDVRLGIGATASIIYEYLRDAGCAWEPTVATALFCGIRYDTADLSRNASLLDEEAYYGTFRHADRELITEIQHPPLPRVYYSELHAALSVGRQHGALVLALLGEVSHPEFVAEMADFFLRMKGCSWVLAGAAFGDEYILSLRTDYAFGKAYPLMRRVLDGTGSFGGHGHIAGGRIKLDDAKESTIRSAERMLRASALEVIGAELEDGIAPEGRLLTE